MTYRCQQVSYLRGGRSREEEEEGGGGGGGGERLHRKILDNPATVRPPRGHGEHGVSHGGACIACVA